MRTGFVSGLPSVTAVIPTPNALRRLPGAIASIGGGDVEVLVIDIDSTSGSREHLQSIAQADGRIRAPVPAWPPRGTLVWPRPGADHRPSRPRRLAAAVYATAAHAQHVEAPLRSPHQLVDHLARQCERCFVSAIDPDIAGQLAADLPREDFVRILQTFEADLGRLAVMLEEAAAAGDVENYRRAAHSLAGAAAAVGARRLEQVARIAMNPRDTHDPQAMARQVRAEAGPALAELAALAKHPPGAP